MEYKKNNSNEVIDNKKAETQDNNENYIANCLPNSSFIMDSERRKYITNEMLRYIEENNLEGDINRNES